jgi:hypothetical protein
VEPHVGQNAALGGAAAEQLGQNGMRAQYAGCMRCPPARAITGQPNSTECPEQHPRTGPAVRGATMHDYQCGKWPGAGAGAANIVLGLPRDHPVAMTRGCTLAALLDG